LFFFSSRRRHTRSKRDWSSDVCSSDLPGKKDDIVYRYPLWRAISDGYVKQPVLVYRNSGYDSEERQLQDAMSLLALKEKAYAGWRAAHPDAKATKPLLFVVCSHVAHACATVDRLRTATFP